ncbi:putative RNA-binding protein, contains TRAM domain [Archaeoglobus sulfaticallidus PM70-1]|uniref:Putative RNA-binding protein, contains TRAM domain n=1 Tax=Archaeoglobus sulfaticallidus PM70-1 TaxID=387631 RepID=N0BEB4_9EURY|nr:TRAM domain-containing protein [Archaeoglobus sulfaticallidus]AGK61959.1 putative RNA-binding protein, contains TRAM domain [Archaeoglobus sulfaticallidus PM70-1]
MNKFEFGMERNPPVNVGDIRTVTVEAIGEKGDGIARISGYVVFVPNVEVDQEVTVRITKVLNKYCFAEVVE